jgi:basic amino acid/polyamine antiporter, APA family
MASITIKKIGIFTAISLVLSNMIGTGVFTSLGYQLVAVQDSTSILLLWAFGGLLALCGALCYAMLGTYYKQSGGDYIFLSRTFHPIVGYLSAWASLVVGFSAPVALAAIAMSSYLKPFGLSSPFIGIGFIVISGVFHSFSIGYSQKFQNINSLFKVIFIIILIGIGFYFTATITHSALQFTGTWPREVVSSGFAISMIYVTYAYTGWNAAAYIVEEIDSPTKNLPKSLLASTAIVTVFYLLLQVVFLRHSTIENLSGKTEVATIAYNAILGPAAGRWVSLFIALQLVATISSYIWIGPRITQAMAVENPRWQFLRGQNENGIPVKAIWIHVLIAIIMALTGAFETILLYAGFVLQLMSTLTVLCVFFIDKQKATFKIPLSPLPQLFYVVFSTTVLGYILYNKPSESLVGVGLLLIGLLFYKKE